MNNVNRTLYIPLYGKAYVSKKGIILQDKKAEAIWNSEGFELKSKSKSKWLAYYMGMRSAVFDNWLADCMQSDVDAVILHIGCGLDSRIYRVGSTVHTWFDIDFPEVIAERKKFYQSTNTYYMLGSDVRGKSWIDAIPHHRKAIVVMEGVSMYMQQSELIMLLKRLTDYFEEVQILLDCYTTFAAKASKYKNPINDVGVTKVFGIDDPLILTEGTGLDFICEHKMTPSSMIDQLKGIEKFVFKIVYSGSIAKKMYRLYEYKNNKKKIKYK